MSRPGPCVYACSLAVTAGSVPEGHPPLVPPVTRLHTLALFGRNIAAEDVRLGILSGLVAVDGEPLPLQRGERLIDHCLRLAISQGRESVRRRGVELSTRPLVNVDRLGGVRGLSRHGYHDLGLVSPCVREGRRARLI